MARSQCYGDSEDDDLIGGWGHDWISGGTGDDGVLGDDGRIWTSRNGVAEPAHDVLAERWRMRAYYVDSAYGAIWSGYTYVTVR